MLETLYQFPNIKKFHDYLTEEELFEVMKLSTVVEVKEDIVDFGDEQILTYYIRKKSLKLNSQYVNFFGYDIETIKMLPIKKFNTF